MNEKQFIQLVEDLRQRIPSLENPVFSGDDGEPVVGLEMIRAICGKVIISGIVNEKCLFITYTGNAKPVGIWVPDADAGMARICEFICGYTARKEG